MFSAYIIEIGEETAGIIAREIGPETESRGRYHFYASAQIFYPLEGREFRSAAAAQRAAQEVWRLWRSRKPATQAAA